MCRDFLPNFFFHTETELLSCGNFFFLTISYKSIDASKQSDGLCFRLIESLPSTEAHNTPELKIVIPFTKSFRDLPMEKFCRTSILFPHVSRWHLPVDKNHRISWVGDPQGPSSPAPGSVQDHPKIRLHDHPKIRLHDQKCCSDSFWAPVTSLATWATVSVLTSLAKLPGAEF